MPADKVREAQNVVEKYSNMSEEDLLKEIAGAIKKQKAGGQFNAAEVKGQINSLSAFLPPEQIKKMNKVLDDFS